MKKRGIILFTKKKKITDRGLNVWNVSQDWVQEVDPKISAQWDPDKRRYFRKEILQYRDELRDGHVEFVKVRRERLKRLIIADTIEQSQCLHRHGYAFIPTHF